MLPSYTEIEFHKMYKGNSVEDFLFYQMVPKQLKSHSQKRKENPSFTPYTKINYKWVCI